jgi:hypothetical protein|tara:strand:+ start:4471 stop:5391 length:921 start_codon:yes stop_codon:yes gene_type:complete
MLVFGDVATQRVYPEHEVHFVDIIYHDKLELEFIVQKYQLYRMTHNATWTHEYVKGNLTYRLFSQDICKILKKILKDSFSLKYKTVIANPFINFIFDTIKVVNYHGRFDDWVNKVKSYNFLVTTYIEDLVALDQKYDRLIDRYHKMLAPFILEQRLVAMRPYVYSAFNRASRTELLSVVTTTVVNFSPYFIIWDDFPKNEETEYLNENKFNNLPYQQKVTACVESLYIDTLNEFVIPQIQETKLQPTDSEIERAFTKCIMYRASQNKMAWLGHFMLYNFFAIVDDFDIGFYHVFQNVLRTGDVVIT